MKRKKILHLDQNHICFENDSVLFCVNESTYFWRNVNVDTLNIEPKRMFPFRLKPDNQSYSCVEYNSDSTLFIIVNHNDVHISRTNGILDELYYQCLF